MAERGTFGDMFGVVNSLFSGLAFAGVIYAILLQRKELELQRKELKLTREELSKSADAQKRSSHILGQQLSVMNQNFNFDQEKEFKKTQPILRHTLSIKSMNPKYEELKFTNMGALVYDVEATAKDDFSISVPQFLSQTENLISIKYDPDNPNLKFRFDLIYTDCNAKRWKKEYEYSLEAKSLVELH